MNGNNSIDVVPDDRTTDTQSAFRRIGSDWWQPTMQRVFATVSGGNEK